MFSQNSFGDAPTPPPAPTPTRAQAVSPVLAVLPIIAGAPVVLRTIASDDGPMKSAVLVGTVIGLLLCSVIVLWISQAAWRVCGRSRAAGNTVFGVLCVLWAVGAWTAAGRESSGRQFAALASSIESQADRSLARAQEELDTQGYVSYDEAAAQQMTRLLDDAGQKMAGNEGAAARVSAAFIREFGERIKAEEAAVDRFIAAGSIEPATLLKRESLSEREALLDVLEAKSTAATAFLRESRERFRQMLIDEGVPSLAATHMTNDFMRGMKPETLVKSREPDAEALASFRAILGILKQHHGRWHVETDGTLVFGVNVPDAVLGEYDMHAGNLETAVQRSTEMQAELLKQRRRDAEQRRVR